MPDAESHSPLSLHPAAEPVVAFGPFRFDRANGLLRRGEDEMPLPPRALAILRVLVERPGRVVSKQTLIAAVWNGAFVSDTSLTEAMSLLRQALGDDPQQPTYIQTLHRRGYRFIAPLEVPPPPPPRLVPLDGPRRPHSAAAMSAAAAPEAVPGADVPPPQPPPAAPARRRALRPAAVALLALGAAAVAAGGFLLGRAAPSAQPERALPLRFAVAPPVGDRIPTFGPGLAVSPDGRELVFEGWREERGVRLLHRSLGRFGTRAIEGTAGATSPFFSPDGRWIGFLDDNRLMKVPLAGGRPVALAQVPGMLGASWGADGRIVYSPGFLRGLWAVPAAGGAPRRLTAPDAARGEVRHEWPEVLPGGGILFTAWSTTVEDSRLLFLPPGGGAPREVRAGAVFARLLGGDRLVFLAPDGVLTARFDARAGRLLDGPVPLPEPMARSVGGYALFATGGDTLAYVPGDVELGNRELAWAGPGGARTPVPAPPRFYRNVAVGPGGGRAAVTVLDGRRSDLWVVGLGDGALTRLTFDGFNIEPTWSADGRWVSFAGKGDTGPFNLFRRPADGSGPAERLVASRRHQYPEAFTPDGRTLVYTEGHPETGFDLWTLDLATRPPRAAPLLRTAANELFAAVSPDGRWLAYTSDISGRWDVYVQALPGGGGKWQASPEGGVHPAWSPAGDRLYYLYGGKVMEVPVVPGPDLRLGKPRLYVERPAMAMMSAGPGRLLLIEDRQLPHPPRELRVVVGGLR